ncbi:protein abrupt isoform X3 [Leguminivora glycinivorella]|uniref:protein abrupt isoform X3 n=1 Tax=Leguminivora glycinivorella TaxID=1035111 RepID=UPI00200F534C|nr:protein abrupt isoform X3 [Leguminivora glycinivorella]
MASDTGGSAAGAGACAGAGAGAGAGGEQQYSLRWNDFHSSIVSSFRRLRDEEDFVDVTLACAGATFTAHKVVLSACSPYFRKLLKANPCQHPIVILRDVHDKDMESLLRFMYQGEVHIGQEQLKEFLRAAQLLQVRGLTDVPPTAPVPTLDQKASPQSASSWTETGSGGSREGREREVREGRRARRPEEGAAGTPPPKRARSSDLYQAQMKTRCRTEQLLAQGSPERNGHELLFGQGLDQSAHLSAMSNNLSGDGEDSSSDAGASDTEGEPRAKQEPLDYDDPAHVANTNGALPHSFPGLLNLQGFPGLPGPSGIPDNFGGSRRTQDLLRVRATDPRPCPKCGKIYRSAHTLRTHLEDKHTVCPGYRCVLCGTVAKSRNSLHSHMSRQHRGISTKDLPVLQMPTRFDPELASQLLAKAGVKVSPEQLRARASPTGPRRCDIKLDAKSAASETSSLCGDNDHDDLSQSRYGDLPVSPPNINSLANTTITKVPAVRALAARAAESAHAPAPRRDDYPYTAGSTLIDTYLQYIGMPNINHLANLNAMHMDRKTYDEPSPQMGSLPPPPATLAHQSFLKQMQRKYTELGKPDITRDADEPLDLGKERARATHADADADADDKEYYGKEFAEDERRDEDEAPDEAGYEDDERKTS